MEQQADRSMPPGWYPVGSGWLAYWDGAGWTGDRVQAPAVTPPPPPRQAQGMPRLWGTPWWVWVILAVIAVIIGLPLLGAFMEGFSTGVNGR